MLAAYPHSGRALREVGITSATPSITTFSRTAHTVVGTAPAFPSGPAVTASEPTAITMAAPPATISLASSIALELQTWQSIIAGTAAQSTAFIMASTTFFASPNTIIVLSM
jgi:hypothetical protein